MLRHINSSDDFLITLNAASPIVSGGPTNVITVLFVLLPGLHLVVYPSTVSTTDATASITSGFLPSEMFGTHSIVLHGCDFH